jgi:hypothetical protein
VHTPQSYSGGTPSSTVRERGRDKEREGKIKRERGRDKERERER